MPSLFYEPKAPRRWASVSAAASGLLHMGSVQSRLNANTIRDLDHTAPTVVYEVETTRKRLSMLIALQAAAVE